MSEELCTTPREVTDQLLTDPVVKRVAAAHQKTSAQAILRWHLQRGLTPIPKGSSKAHVDENFDVGSRAGES